MWRPHRLLDVVDPVTFSPGVTDPAAANELHITPGDQEEADVQLAPVPSAHVIVTGLAPDPPNGPVRYPGITADEQVFGVWLPFSYKFEFQRPMKFLASRGSGIRSPNPPR